MTGVPTGFPAVSYTHLNYVLACGIKGKRWIDDSRWNMIPDLVPDETSVESESEKLEDVNNTRDMVCLLYTSIIPEPTRWADLFATVTAARAESLNEPATLLTLSLIHIFPSFLEKEQLIETDMEKFRRVYESIPKKISPRVQKIIYRVWLSEDENASNLVYKFLRIGYKIGDKVVNYIQEPAVNEVIELNLSLIHIYCWDCGQHTEYKQLYQQLNRFAIISIGKI